MNILVQGMAHWIEASMADLARELGGGERPGGDSAAGANAPSWLTEDLWPAEPGRAPAWHEGVEDGLVVSTTDDVVQLDRSSRLTALRLDIA